jgi:hypothetical protein
MTADLQTQCRRAMTVARRLSRLTRARVVALHAVPVPAIALDRAPRGVVRTYCHLSGSPLVEGRYRGVRVSWPATAGGAA